MSKKYMVCFVLYFINKFIQNTIQKLWSKLGVDNDSPIDLNQGRSPPQANDAFSPISDFLPLFRIFPESGKNLLTFPHKRVFHPPKFLMTYFLVLLFSPKRCYTPPPILKKLLFPIIFFKFSPDFVEFTCFLLTTQGRRVWRATSWRVRWHRQGITEKKKNIEH